MAQSLSAILALLAQLNASGSDPTTPMPPADAGISCQLHDHRLDEMNRLCLYRCGEDEVQVTLPQSEQCPEEIQR
jgi:hypothetical protein